MADSIQIAVEQYLYWRGKGLSVRGMWRAVNGTGCEYGKPEEWTGDGIVFWLATVWDGELSGSEEELE